MIFVVRASMAELRAIHGFLRIVALVPHPSRVP